MPHPIPDIEPTKADTRWEVDFTDARLTEPHPLDMAVPGYGEPDPMVFEGSRDRTPTVILAGIGLVIAALVGVAAWYGANAVGWGL